MRVIVSVTGDVLLFLDYRQAGEALLREGWKLIPDFLISYSDSF
jgi:hypothetical protein